MHLTGVEGHALGSNIKVACLKAKTQNQNLIASSKSKISC